MAINRLLRFLIRRNYRYLMITNEFMPIYHDKFQTSNKTIVLVEKQNKISGSSALVVEGREYSSTFDEIRYKYKKAYSEIRLESQNDNLIQIYKNFKKHTGDPNFELNGFKEGITLEIKGLGFLGDINIIENIFLVTDKYIFTKGAINKGMSCYKHEELQRMKERGALVFL